MRKEVKTNRSQACQWPEQSRKHMLTDLMHSTCHKQIETKKLSDQARAKLLNHLAGNALHVSVQRKKDVFSGLWPSFGIEKFANSFAATIS